MGYTNSMKRVSLTGMVRPVAKTGPSFSKPSKPFPWLRLPWRRLAQNSLMLGAVFAMGVGITTGFFWWSSQQDRSAVLPGKTTRQESGSITITSSAPVNKQIKVQELFSYQVLVETNQPDAVRYEVVSERGAISGLEINEQGYLWWQPQASQAGQYILTITVHVGETMASQSFGIEVVPADQPAAQHSALGSTLVYELGNKQKVQLMLATVPNITVETEEQGLSTTLSKQKMYFSVPTYLYETQVIGTPEPVSGSVEKTLTLPNGKQVVRLKQGGDRSNDVYIYTDKQPALTVKCPKDCYSPFMRMATNNFYVSASITIDKAMPAPEQKAILDIADLLLTKLQVTTVQ